MLQHLGTEGKATRHAFRVIRHTCVAKSPAVSEHRSMSDDYFIGVNEAELARLRDQHAAWLPETGALWQRAGFAAGQRIADLGSGPGFTTFDLARLAGVQGRVAAIDKASQYLRYVEAEAARCGVANVETLELDLMHDSPGDAIYDAAFCRFFLAFVVDDLDAALTNVRRSLK